MKLFLGFLATFLLLFSVVLVVTGEWQNRVRPALRRIVLEQLGVDSQRLAEARSADATGGGTQTGASVDAGSAGAGTGDGMGGGAGAGGGEGEERGGGGGGGAGAGREGTQSSGAQSVADSLAGTPAAWPEAVSDLDSWQEAQEDTLRLMRARVVELAGRIGALEAEFSALRAARAKGELDAWKALSRIFASMRAEEASRVIARLPEGQAVQLLSTMNPRNSAELMGKLEPERAARLSGRLSLYLRDLNAEAELQ